MTASSLQRHRSSNGLAAAALGALIIAAILALTLLHDTSLLNNDAAQYLSVAENLLSGNGASTDFIYYEQHYLARTLPAPQTIFPPGLPAGVAALGYLGVPILLAMFLIEILAFAAIPILMFRILTLSGSSPWTACVLAGTWLGLVVAWRIVLVGGSEVLFTCLTLTSLWLVAEGYSRRGSRIPWLLGCAVAAGLAIAVRYQAVFFLFGLYAVFLVRWLLKRDRKTFWELMAVGMPSGTAALVLAGRNYLLVGTLGGGPVATVDWGLSMKEAVFTFYWELSALLGFSHDRLAGGGHAELALLAVLALSLVWAFLTRPKGWQQLNEPNPRPSGALALSISSVYVVLTLLGLLVLGLAKSGGYIQDRFLIAIIPFAMLTLAEITRQVASRRSLWTRGLVVAALVAFALGQINVWRDHESLFSNPTRYDVIQEALLSPVGGTTVMSFLQARLDAESPLFASESQLAGLILDRPTLGATPPIATAWSWGDELTRRVVRQYHVRYLALFPKLFDPSAPENATRVILGEIYAGQVPDWLDPIVENEQIRLYEVIPEEKLTGRPRLDRSMSTHPEPRCDTTGNRPRPCTRETRPDI